MRDGLARDAVDFGIEKAYGRWYSKYVGIVVDTADPGGLGRIRIRCPGVAGNDVLPKWAWPDFVGAGPGHGMFWPPYVGDRVHTLFELGDPGRPFYQGGWYGAPEGASEVPAEFQPEAGKAPLRRGLKTKNGQMILFDETPGEEKVQIVWSNEDGSKKALVSFDKHGGVAVMGASGRQLVLDEENGQLFYTDVDGDGNAANTLTAKIGDGWTITAAKGEDVVCTLFMDAGGRIGLQAKEDVAVSAPSVALDSSSVATGGTQATSKQVLGTELIALLGELITQIALITVPTGTGPSGPPANAGAISAIGGKLAQALSKGHTIGP